MKPDFDDVDWMAAVTNANDAVERIEITLPSDIAANARKECARRGLTLEEALMVMTRKLAGS